MTPTHENASTSYGSSFLEVVTDVEPAPVEKPKKTTGGHNPALDGLRAIAVLAVFVHHMGLLPGGYMGVDLFLVLSGFLITGLLLAERDRSGRISLRAFWGRRGFRLLPAFYVFTLIGIPAVLILKDHADQVQFLHNGIAAVLYVANIQRTLDPPGGDAWFGHVWTLSLEEQFYVVWPLLLVLICGRTRLRRRLPEILMGLILIVVLWREVLIAEGVSNFRLYYAPDTRVDSLLVGCLLAVWRHDSISPVPAAPPGHARHRAEALSRRRAEALRAVATLGPVALMALVVLFIFGPDLKGAPNWLAYGGYTVVAGIAAIAVAAADQQRPAWLIRFLSTRVMVWIGGISYSFYLWHFPVTGVANDKLVPRFGRVPSAGVALVVSMGLAAASFYLIERPVQRRRPAWTNPGRAVPRPRAESVLGPGPGAAPNGLPAPAGLPVAGFSTGQPIE